MAKVSEINKSLELRQAAHIHEEISLRSENQRLEKQLQERNEQLGKLQTENQQLNEELSTLRTKIDNEISFCEKWKETQAELSDYKRKTFDLLEQQKAWMATLNTEIKALFKERDDTKKELLEKEKTLKKLAEKHHKMMNTKTMKWTGKYWKLRKKMQLKSK